MPYYDLKCKNCGSAFNIKATINEKENRTIKCPECKSNELETVFKTLNYIVKKSGCDVSACPQAHRCNSGCCH